MNRKTHRMINLFDWTFVQEALKRTLTSGARPEMGSDLTSESRDIEISLIINDIFGGRILKTQDSKGRHFYNRINGKRIEIGTEEIYSVSDATDMTNIPAPGSETTHYKKHEDYSDFFLRFVRAFEETVGLDSYQTA